LSLTIFSIFFYSNIYTINFHKIKIFKLLFYFHSKI
jgi:hypothetical protein